MAKSFDEVQNILQMIKPYDDKINEMKDIVCTEFEFFRNITSSKIYTSEKSAELTGNIVQNLNSLKKRFEFLHIQTLIKKVAYSTLVSKYNDCEELHEIISYISPTRYDSMDRLYNINLMQLNIEIIAPGYGTTHGYIKISYNGTTITDIQGNYSTFTLGDSQINKICEIMDLELDYESHYTLNDDGSHDGAYNYIIFGILNENYKKNRKLYQGIIIDVIITIIRNFDRVLIG